MFRTRGDLNIMRSPSFLVPSCGRDPRRRGTASSVRASDHRASDVRTHVAGLATGLDELVETGLLLLAERRLIALKELVPRDGVTSLRSNTPIARAILS